MPNADPTPFPINVTVHDIRGHVDLNIHPSAAGLIMGLGGFGAGLMMVKDGMQRWIYGGRMPQQNNLQLLLEDGLQVQEGRQGLKVAAFGLVMAAGGATLALTSRQLIG